MANCTCSPAELCTGHDTYCGDGVVALASHLISVEAASEIVATHTGDSDGRCAGCSHSTRWPCFEATVAHYVRGARLPIG